jgi:hypothetical protein
MKLLFFLMALLPNVSFAHVKWFSNYDFQHAPLTLSELPSPYFWGLFLLSIVSLPLLVWTDKLGEKWPPYQKFNGFLDQYADNGPAIMRITMAAVLLMSWQGDSVIAPEIPISAPFWGWFQLFLALCLLFKQTTFITGLGVVFLYFMGMTTHGMFHMLDYVVYPAVGVYLIVSYAKNERIKNLDLPVLYGGLGFSLCWVAFEKLVYPYWGLSVLAQAPELTMGLNHEFFLLACAFIEFTLGYLLIICLLHRPLAVVITLVFFTTTTFFGKTEVVGHTILHGALLVFIVRGPGHYYQAPIRFHKSLWMRSLFAMVNFVILFAVLAFPYEKMALAAHKKSMTERAAMAHPQLEIPAGAPVPRVMIHASPDSNGGWNLHLMTENFRFTPGNAGKDDILGEGHAHLYVNGKKIGRVYGEWVHVSVAKGVNKIRVTLNSNTHKDYYTNGQQIAAEIEISEEREVKAPQHQH